MTQKPIEFRELLERVLPLDQLPPPDRLLVQRALQCGLTRQLEAAALMAMERLERQGALLRLPPTANGHGSEVRFQPRDSFEVITLKVSGPSEKDGVMTFPRTILPARAPAGVDQVRRLLRLDDPGMFSVPGHQGAGAALRGQLDVAGRELLGASSVGFFRIPATGDEGDERSIDADLAAETVALPGVLRYCPDVSKAPRLAARAVQQGVRAVVLAAVVSSEGAPIGVLEVRSATVAPFGPEDLARVALLADCCGAVLERATRIEKLVFVDPLTSVYNRSYFELQAHNEMARARREQASMALCIADIDDFKSFNTEFGYEAGNEVLAQVAQALKHGVRPFDTVARWGGEEFAVLLTSPVQAEDVRAICERLRTAVQRLDLTLEGLDRRRQRVYVTLSIGVALLPEHAENTQDLWRAANQALLAAKRPPKNQVVFYDPQRPGA